jgi:hypothetical protein
VQRPAHRCTAGIASQARGTTDALSTECSDTSLLDSPPLRLEHLLRAVADAWLHKVPCEPACPSLQPVDLRAVEVRKILALGSSGSWRRVVSDSQALM